MANVLKGLLGELGSCDALLVRKTDQGLMLLDGHLRTETAPETILPVLVLDVNQAEADKLLVSLDNLTNLAEPDKGQLAALLASLETQSEAAQTWFDRLAERSDDFRA